MINQNIKEIIELDNELKKFLDKYGSKLPYSLEIKLNREWKKVSKIYKNKADEIFGKMSNGELLIAIGMTEYIFTIVNIVDYFQKIKIDFDKIKDNPDLLINMYFRILKEDLILKEYAISDYYYEKIKAKNNIENIEKILLSNMTNEQIGFLASNSNQWLTKLYYYGFLKN